MKELGIIVLLIIIALIFMGINETSRENEIKEKVASIGGTYIDSEHKLFDIDTGPFAWYETLSKYDHVWRFTYSKDGKVHEGWVLFSTFNTEWRF